MNRQKGIALLLLIWLATSARASDIETLAQGIAERIKEFFQDKAGITAAITRLENQTTLKGNALERIYQLIYSRLIGANDNQFHDFLIEFRDQTAHFNLSRADDLQYPIYLKFIEQEGRIGAGIVIFSRRLDQIVHVKYFDAPISNTERELLEIRQFGFSEIGFSRLVEIDIRSNLMNSLAVEMDGQNYLFLLYPRQIEVQRVLDHGIEKHSEIPLNWPKPLFPVRHFEGRLSTFLIQGKRYLAAGCNFSKQAVLFEFRDQAWRASPPIPFTPLADILINGVQYLAGAAYDPGKNCFQDRMYFLPVSETAFSLAGLLEKSVPPFYDCAFIQNNRELESVHFVSLDSQHKSFAADLVTPIASLGKKGGAMANLDHSWLALTEYSNETDRLYFCKVDQLQCKPIYENPIAGEVEFLSPGTWKGSRGFWAYIRSLRENQERFTLQFWSKKGE